MGVDDKDISSTPMGVDDKEVLGSGIEPKTSFSGFKTVQGYFYFKIIKWMPYCKFQ